MGYRLYTVHAGRSRTVLAAALEAARAEAERQGGGRAAEQWDELYTQMHAVTVPDATSMLAAFDGEAMLAGVNTLRLSFGATNHGGGGTVLAPGADAEGAARAAPQMVESPGP